jgi:hypothetical protein
MPPLPPPPVPGAQRRRVRRSARFLHVQPEFSFQFSLDDYFLSSFIIFDYFILPIFHCHILPFFISSASRQIFHSFFDYASFSFSSSMSSAFDYAFRRRHFISFRFSLFFLSFAYFFIISQL